MSAMSEESFRAKVRAILAAGASRESLDRLGVAVDGEFHGSVARAYPHLSAETASELAFHLSDWREDAAFIVALALSPERFTAEEIEDGLTAFLVHAPNHVAAAAKLGGWPVADIFELGALDAERDHRDPAV